MLLDFDTQLFLTLHSFALENPDLIALVFFAAQPLVFISFFAGLLVLFWYYDPRPGLVLIHKETFVDISLVTLSAFLASAIARLIKVIIGRARPFLDLDISPLFRYGGFDSFPSEHAMVAFAVAGSLFMLHKKLGIIAIVAAFGVGLGRIMAGVHFPLDVTVGAIIGMSIGVLMAVFAKETATKITDLALEKIARQL